MSITDKNQRQQAVPYIGQIMGYNHSAQSDQDVSIADNTQGGGGGLYLGTDSYDPTGTMMLSGLGDLYPLAGNTSQTDYMIRVLRPKFGQIIQAYLNISLTFSASEPNPKFRVSVGGAVGTDHLTASVPNNTFITNCMTVLSPTSPYFTGQAGQALVLYGVNIQPLLPQVGSANYNQDFYTVGIHFATAPIQSGAYHLTKFFITGSILVN